MQCVLPATVDRGVTRTQADSRHRDTSGDIVATIPAAVFIRSDGNRLVTTTNTGRRPQPLDTFYITAHRRTYLASPTLRREIITRCTELR